MGEMVSYQMLIDGQWFDAGDGAMFDSINPTTGKIWARIPEATADDVDRIGFAGGSASARHIIRNSADNLAEISRN